MADLLDLQFELNSLQQGIRQMDKITPDNPRPTEDPFDADPFGDSFANMKVIIKLFNYSKLKKFDNEFNYLGKKKIFRNSLQNCKVFKVNY